jgi:hypothetical protein
MRGAQVDVYQRQQSGNLSGTGDPNQTFVKQFKLTCAIAKPRTTDEIVDPMHQGGYNPDEYWTLLYPSSATIRYRDLVTLSTTEGGADYIVTQPIVSFWGNSPAIKKATIRRVVNLSGPGFPVAEGWPG